MPVIWSLGAVPLPGSWFDSGCGVGPRARWLPDGRIEIEGEGTPSKGLSNQIPKWMPTIQEMSAKHGVPASLVAGVMMTESGGQPYAKSYCCYGLMGFLPQTASFYAGRPVTGSELQDNPKLSIELGAKMLAALMAKYQGNVIKVATSYNAGGPYCTPAKGCSSVNRWGMRADCVNGQAVDYPTRVISYANASLGVQPGAIVPSSSSSSSGLGFWQWAGLAAVGIAGVVWARKSGVLKKLRANPETVQLIMRATTLLQYMSTEEAIETLARDVGRDRAYLVVKAAEIRAKDMGPELAGNPKYVRPPRARAVSWDCLLAGAYTASSYEKAERAHAVLYDASGKTIGTTTACGLADSKLAGGASTEGIPRCAKCEKRTAGLPDIDEYLGPELMGNPMDKQALAAVQAMQLYAGSSGLPIKTQQRFYDRATRLCQKIATRKGFELSSVVEAVAVQAERRGKITPIPGKDY